MPQKRTESAFKRVSIFEKGNFSLFGHVRITETLAGSHFQILRGVKIGQKTPIFRG